MKENKQQNEKSLKYQLITQKKVMGKIGKCRGSTGKWVSSDRVGAAGLWGACWRYLRGLCVALVSGLEHGSS